MMHVGVDLYCTTFLEEGESGRVSPSKSAITLLPMMRGIWKVKGAGEKSSFPPSPFLPRSPSWCFYG
jgi:hypothetical protein